MERVKLTTPADLEKFSKGLKSHFHKTAAIHKTIAEHHSNMAKAHTEHAAFAKGKHDAMDDGDVMKAFMGRVSAHHEAKAAHHTSLHKAYTNMNEENKELADSIEEHTPIQTSTVQGAAKAAGSEPDPAAVAAAAATANAAGTGIGDMLDKTLDGLLKKALETLNSDPKVAEKIQELVLEKVNEALGNKLQPTAVNGVIPPGRAITRTGQPQIVKGIENVAPELQDLCAVEDN